ncbi:MAG TPA: leucyl aminopeptidase family protein [Stellaceae bacterium]|nr:leucyl aminopeptidase family protein [Stellaceae bacterium]
MLASLVPPGSGFVPIMPVTAEELIPRLAGLGAATERWAEATRFAAEPGKLLLIPDETGRLGHVLVGMAAGEWLWAIAHCPDALPEGTYRVEGVAGRDAETRLALGWALGSYAFTRYRRRERGFARLEWPAGADRARVEALADAIALARDLINTPAEDMGPAELAGAAEDMAARTGARCSVIVGDRLLDENYPAIHAVGRASTRAPRLVDLTWGDPRAPRLTLVGKGVCFDSGGLDLKPAAGMRMMKKDMGGAATLMGLAQAVMALKLPVRLRLLVPAVENSVAGNAFRPLDVIRTRKGITVEVGNTDAEGRLVLCDALTEACREEPALVLDMATLTGAARVALGPELPALFANDDALAAELLGAGTAEGDPLWRLPLWAPYRELLKSPVADINNVSDGGFAGAITAALYLAEFVPATIPWAHIDTYAWNAKSRPGRPEGGEALALRALLALVERRFAGTGA